jgi:hypothetical protein
MNIVLIYAFVSAILNGVAAACWNRHGTLNFFVRAAFIVSAVGGAVVTAKLMPAL